jgi:hypothetical protein
MDAAGAGPRRKGFSINSARREKLNDIRHLPPDPDARGKPM